MREVHYLNHGIITITGFRAAMPSFGFPHRNAVEAMTWHGNLENQVTDLIHCRLGISDNGQEAERRQQKRNYEHTEGALALVGRLFVCAVLSDVVDRRHTAVSLSKLGCVSARFISKHILKLGRTRGGRARFHLGHVATDWFCFCFATLGKRFPHSCSRSGA